MTRVINQNQQALLINALNDGEAVAFPTETVYGVAVKFNDRDALNRLMEAKQRDYSKAITLMLSNINDIKKYAYVDDRVMKIAHAFMPGRITLILKRKESVDPMMTNGLPTIGIRIPDSAFVLDLIDHTGPLLVTSANLSGHPNTTNEKEVLEQLDGRISIVVKGQTGSAQASTVVQLSEGKLKILREGIISKNDLEEVLAKVKIAVACDHAGFRLKNVLIEDMRADGYEIKDFGTYSEESCDYPDYVIPAAKAVAKGEYDYGVVVCGTGLGVSMTANKVHGIRCAVCHDVFSAKATRKHNNANMLAMGQRVVGEGVALEVLHAFLKTDYEGGRHQRRIDKMMALEKER